MTLQENFSFIVMLHPLHQSWQIRCQTDIVMIVLASGGPTGHKETNTVTSWSELHPLGAPNSSSSLPATATSDTAAVEEAEVISTTIMKITTARSGWCFTTVINTNKSKKYNMNNENPPKSKIHNNFRRILWTTTTTILAVSICRFVVFFRDGSKQCSERNQRSVYQNNFRISYWLYRSRPSLTMMMMSSGPMMTREATTMWTITTASRQRPS